MLQLALTCSGLGSRVGETRDVRGSYKNPPHLHALSFGNSFDPGPARSGRRPSEGRCGGGGAIGGEIVPHPPSHLSLSTVRFDGHTTSSRKKHEGGPSCRRSSEERCIPGKGSAATDRGHAAAGRRSVSASALRRRPGLTRRLQTEDLFMSKRGAWE